MKSGTIQIIVIGVFIIFIIAAVIIFSMSRSGNSGQANQNVKVVIWGTIPEEKFMPTVERANTEFPGSVNLSYKYKDAITLQNDLTAALLDGKGYPDGLLIPHSLLITLQKRLTLIAWTAVSERDLKNNYAEAGEIFFTPSGTYAIPFLIDPLVLYWNRDIFNSQGITNPPAQWQDLEGLVTRFTELNENKTVRKSMIALGEYQNVPHAKAILSALALQVGSRFISWNGDKLSLDMQIKPEGSEDNPHESALLFFAQFSNPNNPLYSWTRAMPNAEQFFLQGDSAMYIGFGSEAQDLRAKNPNLNFDIALLPQAKSSGNLKRTYGEVYGLTIVNASLHKEA
ncbi:MAG TPA: extracellular solute-binding protein, partial [Candidatus Paceibacterota bacterium]|nr:extracellular solute-binding protein [Candidatus Paceibacterota bacterium]